MGGNASESARHERVSIFASLERGECMFAYRCRNFIESFLEHLHY